MPLAVAAHAFRGCISCNPLVPIAALGPELSAIQPGLSRHLRAGDWELLDQLPVRNAGWFREISCAVLTGEALFTPHRKRKIGACSVSVHFDKARQT